MNKHLNDLLSSYRSAAKSEREKGTYFERLAIAFLKNDPVQAAQYDDVWSFADWAEQQELDRRDTGIDLVARMSDGGGYCAIQCKFYDADKRISKSEIDSFFTASGKAPFSRRLIIDTTDANWSEHAEAALRDQQIETMRISLADLSESPIDWTIYLRDEKVVLASKKKAMPHQAEALDEVEAGFETADRGKLLMACGTGKTFTALKIAERLAGRGKSVLYLVPSLALMAQTVREWTFDSGTSLRSFAVCSDVQVGKRRVSDDIADLEIHDLAFPATTNGKKLASKAVHAAPEDMTVVFSTYQSIQAISEAQLDCGLPEFDLIICDEAHRTTGAIFADGEESNFVKVHRQDFIRGKKRLYMTATPRIYGDQVKSKAAESSVELCSMDDVSLYGEVLFQRGFSWAVQNGLLTDYKVIVLAVDEQMVSAGVQSRLTDENSQLLLDDATKIIGCYKALTKADLKQDVASDPHPMRRALAFCKDIKSSKLITNEFSAVVSEYVDSAQQPEEPASLCCELNHVDGTFNAKSRTMLLDWLKDETENDICRILSNARCLSEGVDVPALDAIMFLHPRKSQIDVVQSVGRVMRRAPDKRMGYVILPVGIPVGMSPEEALNNNEKYKVVWQILNALRAHDDRFDATINKMELGADVTGQIEIIAVTNELPQQAAMPESAGIGGGSAPMGDDSAEDTPGGFREPAQAAFVFDEFASAIMAKIVKKCGRRTYWEDWASDIAKIAQTHITRIKAVIEAPGTKERRAFDGFLEELQDDLNDSITEDEAVEMLAQHLITRPVFEALFTGHSFVRENPVSKAMQSVLDVLEEQHLEKEAESLEKFYASVKFRAAGIDNAEGKQRIVVELYDKFFRKAFPRMTERLGIVYTPVEVVDFILHSVNEVLQSEFGQTFGSIDVHIIDPFVGTGTFITRLLQSGLIKPEELEHKYRHEIHANEIVLLAYYIAAINIEAVYHDLSEEGEYLPFEGICLTDTFQMYECDDLVSHYMPDNSERRKRQKALDLQVVIGNPPYSGQQGSENENNKNTSYLGLDKRIRDTYARESSSKLAKSNYDSYVRAIRWASDRIRKKGIAAFVTNGSFIDAKNMDGLRKTLCAEFTSLYVFNLRGDQRTAGEASRREGGKVFGSGSRTPVAITILVKRDDSERAGKLRYFDIGDYLTREDKLKIIAELGSISAIRWNRTIPNEDGDWINQRDPAFQKFLPLAERDAEKGQSVFASNSYGVVTSRDPWVYNSSVPELTASVGKLIGAFNQESKAYRKACDGLAKEAWPLLENVVSSDPKRISWSRALKKDAERGKTIDFDPEHIVPAAHRPFGRQYMYFDRRLNEMVNLTKRMFPSPRHDNVLISCTGVTKRKGFSCLVANHVPSMHLTDTGMCYPLYYYENQGESADLFDDAVDDPYLRRDGVTDWALGQFRRRYRNLTISREDIFWYSYAVLHRPEYRARFTADLQKGHPRLPFADNFHAYCEAGRTLGELHLNFDTVTPYSVTIKQGDLRFASIVDPENFYRVEKMKFAGKQPNRDKSTVVYNANITMTDIPLEAYDYVVNGKSALEWVMEQQVVKTDKASGIVNDANRYAIETVGNPAYPLELFQRVITVSLETMKIVRALPKLEID